MTIRYAPTASLRHNETLPGGEVEICITVRYIQADYPMDGKQIRDKALHIIGDLAKYCDQYRDKSD